MKAVLITGLVLILLGVGLNVGVPYPKPEPHNYVVTAPSPAPYFAEMEQKLGLTGEGKRIFELSKPSCVPALSDGRRGEYRLGKIYVICDKDSVTFTAHEYLHAVWERTGQKAALTADLRAFYDRYSYRVAPRFKYYTDRSLTPDQLMDEYHSIFGTEINDSQLSPRLQAWYAKWLPNRSALPSLCC